jgi:hypothetical protein
MKASKIKSICATFVLGLALALSFAGSWENSVAASPEKKDTPGKKTGKDYAGQNCEHKTGQKAARSANARTSAGPRDYGKDRSTTAGSAADSPTQPPTKQSWRTRQGNQSGTAT